MIHIVFEREAATALQKSFEIDESMSGQIFTDDEDWSVGPLAETRPSEESVIDRRQWLNQIFGRQPDVEHIRFIESVKTHLVENPDEAAWIWIAPNSRDICGYYHLATGLSQYQGRIFVLWLNNLPFINEKGEVFYPKKIGEIPPKEFTKARLLAQEVSISTFETDADDWKKAEQENKMLRVFEGGRKVAGKDEDYYDKQIVSLAQPAWQRTKTLLRQLTEKSNDIINSVFFTWRVRGLINQEKLEGRGDWEKTENFEVRLKPAANSEIIDE